MNDFIIIKENLDILDKLNIKVEEFGISSFRIIEHPTWFPKNNEDKIIRNIFELIISSEKNFSFEKFNKNLAATIACKASVKGNTNITIEAMESIINDLRKGKYDVLVGINLLREGLDIPEVSLVAILDADKQGFLRSERSLIQTIGRAARNANGKVIMYADTISESMDKAIKETNRRRKIQEEYNLKNNIIPKTIIKEIREVVTNNKEIEKEKISKKDKQKLMIDIEREMKEAAKNLDFERAMELRDILFEYKSSD